MMRLLLELLQLRWSALCDGCDEWRKHHLLKVGVLMQKGEETMRKFEQQNFLAERVRDGRRMGCDQEDYEEIRALQRPTARASHENPSNPI